MTRLAILLGCTLAAITAQARIGESPEQITTRYGKPARTAIVFDLAHPLERGNVYHRNGVEISVVFFKGKSASERFRKLDQAKFSDDEIADLLHANQPIEKWKQDAETSNADLTNYDTIPTAWDGLLACWSHQKDFVQTLEIHTLEYGMEQMADDEKGQRQKPRTNLTGF